MSHSGSQRRRRGRAEARAYALRLQALERKVAAYRNGVRGTSNRTHLTQVRAGLHELINEMERLQKPREGRAELVAQASRLLDQLPQGKRSTERSQPRAPIQWSGADVLDRKRIELLKARLKKLQGDVGRLVSERNRRLKTGLALDPGSSARHKELERELLTLIKRLRTIRSQQQRNSLVDRAEQSLKQLRRLPYPPQARQPRLAKRARTTQQKARNDSIQARYRAAIELDKLCRENDRSVRTVSGGLPGLGKRR